MSNGKPALNSPEFWEATARKYAARNDNRTREHEFTEAAEHCIGPVLEVGPAFGGFTQYLPDDMQYVGIDLSAYLIARARVRFPARIFLVGDVTKLGRGWWGAFETVAAFEVLEHFEKPIELVARLSKIARGRLVFGVPRGQPTHTSHYHDGHVSGWVDNEDFRRQFQRFGKVSFWSGNNNHICGTIEFGGE